MFHEKILLRNRIIRYGDMVGKTAEWKIENNNMKVSRKGPKYILFGRNCINLQ